jgi:hypothetical protein
VAPEVEEWLRDRGVPCRPMDEEMPTSREVILVGQAEEHAGDLAGWQRLISRVDRGSTAVFVDPAAFRRTRALVGAVELSGVMFPNVSSAAIENAPESEWPVFQSEVLGDLVFDLTGLPEADYTLELGMCELTFGGPNERLFDLDLNGRRVLERFDLFREAGGRFRALSRRFLVRPDSGQIKVQFLSRRNLATVSRLRLYDAAGRLVIESDYPGRERDRVGWLPLTQKGQCNEIWDWLYHKECVAKRHPVFADLPAGGILDWDYYGPVIPKRLFTGQATPDEVVAAAFAVGYPCPGGYYSGVLLGAYRFGAGRFLVSTFQILNQIDRHPAADRLLVNLLTYGGRQARKPAARAGRGLAERLAAIGYE